jgi:xylan 1,4-beta-xylosidase
MRLNERGVSHERSRFTFPFMQIISGQASLARAAPSRAVATQRVHFRPDWSGPTTPFRHTWEGVVNIDQFRWMVRRDVQEQLELAHHELRARHVRAVGMYDDEMRVFCPSPASFMGFETKEPRTNWQMVDYVMDSLLDRGLQPMFTTSFVPSGMASGPVTVFSTRAHTSPPKDWRQWTALVRGSVQHAVDRYSLETVRQWHFEVWNEPNLQGWFWGGTQEDFFRLWETTFNAIKSVDGALRVGGPSTARADWLEELLAFGAKHGCPPDYLITHIYNNDRTTSDPLAPFAAPQPEKTSTSPDTATGFIRRVRQQLDRAGFKGQVHWNEWGRSFHGVDPRREHPSEAAFIARFLAEVSQAADVFAYWCLSDVYDQVGYGREAFFGGYGLLSLQGLRKPAYQVFQLLAQLGEERVAAAGEGTDSFCNAIVTARAKSSRRAHVLVYAYDHDDEPVTHAVEVAVDLPRGARPGALYRVDSTENNVIARWRELGSPAYLSRAQTRELAAGNQLSASPSNAVRTERADDGTIARFVMESPGVALLEVEMGGTE